MGDGENLGLESKLLRNIGFELIIYAVIEGLGLVGIVTWNLWREFW